MRYTVNREGQFSQHEVEAVVYAATYPTAEEQQQAALQGAIAALVVAALILARFVIS